MLSTSPSLTEILGLEFASLLYPTKSNSRFESVLEACGTPAEGVSSAEPHRHPALPQQRLHALYVPCAPTSPPVSSPVGVEGGHGATF